MGIELALFRARIGLFSMHAKKEPKGSKNQKYKSYTRGTDVHYRSFVCGLYLIFIFMLCHLGLTGMKLCTEYFVSTNSFENYIDVCDAKVHCVYWSLTSTLYGGQYGSFSQRLLLLGGDIELNPGPPKVDNQLSEETKMILNAISESEKKMSGEINAARVEFMCELKNLKTDLLCVKSKIEHVEKNTGILDERVGEIEAAFGDFEYSYNHLINDIKTQRDFDKDRLELIEYQLNQIESEKLKCSLRIFGLPEHETDVKTLTSIVEDEVLSVIVSSETNVEKSKIVSAKRFGRVSASKPRMVIIKFHEFNDKKELFRYRQELKAKNIRISNDLTYAQRQMIKMANDQGFRAYFRNGKFVKEPMDQRSATRKKGIRTLDERNRDFLKSQQHGENEQAETSAGNDVLPVQS